MIRVVAATVALTTLALAASHIACAPTEPVPTNAPPGTAADCIIYHTGSVWAPRTAGGYWWIENGGNGRIYGWSEHTDTCIHPVIQL